MTNEGGGGYTTAEEAVANQAAQMGLSAAEVRDAPDRGTDSQAKALISNGAEVALIETSRGPSGDHYVTRVAWCADSGIDFGDVYGHPADEPGDPGPVAGDDESVSLEQGE